LIRGLKEIIEGSGFPVKASWGLDYGKTIRTHIYSIYKNML